MEIPESISVKLRLLLTVLLCAQFRHLPQAVLADDPDPVSLLHECKKAWEDISDYTAILIAQGGDPAHRSTDGELGREERIRIKYRKNPHSVYLHWLNRGPDKGREAIYPQRTPVCGAGVSDLVLTHWYAGPINFNRRFSPSPDSLKRQARELQHVWYTVMRADLGDIVPHFLEETEIARKRGEVSVRYLGSRLIDDKPVHVIAGAFTARREDYPVWLTLIHIDKQIRLPVKILAYDWDDRLVESCTYGDLELNVGLADADFDPVNLEYNFGVHRCPSLPWLFKQGQKE